MSQESFISEWRLPITFLVLALIVGIIWYVLIGHDVLASMDGINKGTIQWIDSQTDCKWLIKYDTDLGIDNKWFKDSSDNELMKKMRELKC